MSAKIMGQIWDLDLAIPKLVVLLALADHADHNGDNVHPGTPLIAWKTGYSERHVRRVIDELIKDKVLVVVSVRQGKTTLYRINVEAGKHKEPFRVREDVTPDMDVTPDIAMSPLTSDVTPTPDMDVTPTPDIAMSAEPSFEPSVNHHIQKRVSKPKAEKPTPQTNPAALALLTAFGVNDFAFTRDVIKPYEDTARKLIAAGVAYERFGEFYLWMKKLSGNNWTFTHKTLIKYVAQFLKETSAPPAPASPLPPVSTTPGVHIVPTQDTWKDYKPEWKGYPRKDAG